MIPGYATAAGTSRYSERQITKKKELYRLADGILIPAVGIGTYLGHETEEDDLLYSDAIEKALSSGCNLIDTAINYRGMRSEKNIGAVLKKLIESKKLLRDEVIVCTKGGFLPTGGHSMEPKVLEELIETSRSNLGLEMIDLYYLHNPETQLGKISHDEFYQKLEKAFGTLEEAVAAGKIRRYGMATWTAFREPNQIALERCIEIAHKVAGRGHHFRAIQLPYNISMIEAFGSLTQPLKGELVCPFEAAATLGLSVFCSASLLQAKLLGRLPEELRKKIPGYTTDAQRALSFVLSTPGVTSALVGMKRASHVEENLKVLEVSPLDSNQFQALFQG